MPTESKQAEPAPSLATGHALNESTWADFVQRLRYDCVGPRCKDHSTSAALFKVENRRLVTGIDLDFDPEKLIYCDHEEWFSPKEYWDDLTDDESRACINRRTQEHCGKQFMKADIDDQWEVLGALPDHQLLGYAWEWEYVNCHFTYDAAKAFIKRKKHDYRELRVYVDSQYWCWEFEAIKAAILDGTLTYTPKEAA